MFFFPRKEFMREKLVRHELSGVAEKSSDNMLDLDKIDDADWEPSNLIADGMTELGEPFALPPGSSSDMPPSAPPLICPFSGEASSLYL